MALGRQRDRQSEMLVAWSEMPRSPGHVFYDRLQAELAAAEFDGFVEDRCAPYYAARRGRPEGLLIPGGACGVGTAVAVRLDQPLGVVAGDEDADGIPHLLDGLEDASVHDLLLEGAEETLDHTIRLGLADEGVARGDAPE